MSFYKQNFILCPGVEKCGTTSLHALLNAQQNLIVPERKELFYFNTSFEKGEAHYRTMFNNEPDNPGCWFVDITPSYFRRPKTLDRIKSSLTGNVAIIFLIRNPVKRAFSFYWHDMVRHILRGEKTANGFERFTNCSFTHFIQARNDYYLTRYANALKMWFEAFPGRCAVHLTEEVTRNTTPLIADLNRLCELDIPTGLVFPRENAAHVETISIFPKGIRRHTATGIKSTELERQHAINAMAIQGSFTHFVSKQDCDDLYQEFFAEDVRACEKLLGRSLSIFSEQSDMISPMIKTLSKRASL